METKHYQMTLGEYLKQYRNGSIKLFEGQRSFVWKLNQQKGLLLSLIEGSGMPEILLGSTMLSDPQILDGQQRTKTLESFVYELDSLRTPVNLDNKDISFKTFSALPKVLQDKILDTMISIEHKVDCTKEQLTKLYVMRNNGTPLKREEKRKAVVGSINTLIYTKRPTNATNLNTYFTLNSMSTSSTRSQILGRLITAALIKTGEITLKPGFSLHSPSETMYDSIRSKYNTNSVTIPAKTIEYLDKSIFYIAKAENSPSSRGRKLLTSSVAGQIAWGTFVVDNLTKFTALSPTDAQDVIDYIVEEAGNATIDEFSSQSAYNSQDKINQRHTFLTNKLAEALKII